MSSHADTLPPGRVAAQLFEMVDQRDLCRLWAAMTVDLRATFALPFDHRNRSSAATGWHATAPLEPGWPQQLTTEILDQLAEWWQGWADCALVDVEHTRADLVQLWWQDPTPWGVDEHGGEVLRTIRLVMQHQVDVAGAGWRLAGWNDRVADMSWPPHFDPLTPGWDRCHLRDEGTTG